VSADEATGAVVFRRPRAQVEARRRHRAGNDANPRLVAESRAVFANEHGVREAIGDRSHANPRIAIKRAVDSRELIAVGCHGFGNVIIETIGGLTTPGLLNSRVGHIVGMCKTDWRIEIDTVACVSPRALYVKSVAAADG